MVRLFGAVLAAAALLLLPRLDTGGTTSVQSDPVVSVKAASGYHVVLAVREEPSRTVVQATIVAEGNLPTTMDGRTQLVTLGPKATMGLAEKLRSDKQQDIHDACWKEGNLTTNLEEQLLEVGDSEKSTPVVITGNLTKTCRQELFLP